MNVLVRCVLFWLFMPNLRSGMQLKNLILHLFKRRLIVCIADNTPSEVPHIPLHIKLLGVPEDDDYLLVNF